MKKDIHPKYYLDALATCVCGASYVICAPSQKVSIEICSACHPFYTGNEKILDTAGRVDRFKKRAQAGKKDSQTKSA